MTLRRQSSRNKLDEKSTTERTTRTSKRISSWEEDQLPAKRHKAANAGLPLAANTALSQPPARKLTYQRSFAYNTIAEPLGKKKAANATPKKTTTKTTTKPTTRTTTKPTTKTIKKAIKKTRTPHQKLPLLGRIAYYYEDHHTNTDI